MTDDRGYMGQYRPVDDLVEKDPIIVRVVRRSDLLEVYINGFLLENVEDEDSLWAILWTMEYCGAEFEVTRFVIGGDGEEPDDDFS